MNEYFVLSDEDDDLLKSLLKLTNSLNKLDEILYSLELEKLNNLDDYEKITEKYNKYIEYRKITIETETEKYKNFSLDQCYEFINFLSFKIDSDIYDNFEVIILQENNNKAIRRIISILNKKILLNKEAIEETISYGLSDNDDFLELVEETYNINYIKMQIENESLNIFLSFVQEAINDKNYSQFIPELLKIKYDVAFINKDIEEELIGNNFNIQDSSISKHKPNISKDNNLVYEIIKSIYDSFEFNMKKLLNISDIDYSFKNKVISSILRQSMIRTAFLLMNDEQIEYINLEYNKFIDDPSFSQTYEQCNISKEMINQAFDKNKNDKEKHKIISFNIKKN